MARSTEISKKRGLMNLKVFIGVDEAGRGAVVGPLSITAVAIEESILNELTHVIKYDSKKYTPNSREKLFSNLLSKTGGIIFQNILISPEEINRLMEKKVSLNVIELNGMSRAIQALLNKIKTLSEELEIEIYIDSIYADQTKCKFAFLSRLNEMLLEFKKHKIICEHKADENYLPVRIASIISKVIRDREIKKLHHIYGDFGSGYPSDPKTMEFLKRFALDPDQNKVRKIIRIYWKTWRRLVHKDVEEN